MNRIYIFILLLLTSLSGFAYTPDSFDNDGIELKEKDGGNKNGGPQMPVLSPVMGKYVEGGVFIFSHADGMASVTAEDEDGLTIFSTIGNLGEGIFVPLSNVCGSVTLTVVYDTVIYTAEI